MLKRKIGHITLKRTNIADTKAKSLIIKWHEKLGHSNEASLEEMLEMRSSEV